MKKVNLVAATLVILAAASMFGCNSNANKEALVAQQWMLERVENSDSATAINVPNNVYIIFSDSAMVYGRAGCNNFFSQYQTTGSDGLSFGNIGSTMMYCLNMPFETAYLKMLETANEFKANETSLQIKGNGGKFTLFYRPRTQQEIEAGNSRN